MIAKEISICHSLEHAEKYKENNKTNMNKTKINIQARKPNWDIDVVIEQLTSHGLHLST